MVFERLAIRLQEQFADEPEAVRFEYADETVKITFDDEIVARVKKAHALALYFVWYNFCRVHKTLGVISAMGLA